METSRGTTVAVQFLALPWKRFINGMSWNINGSLYSAPNWSLLKDRYTKEVLENSVILLFSRCKSYIIRLGQAG